MWLLYWSILISIIVSLIVKWTYSTLPGSLLMIIVINFSGSFIFTSGLGLGINFWKDQIINVPAIGIIILGSILYMCVWYFACRKLAIEDI